MEITLNVPSYSSNEGFKFDWEYGFEIECQIDHGAVRISANKAGLILFAKHLMVLAQEQVPVGYHLHFDENNSLEGGSVELIIDKK